MSTEFPHEMQDASLSVHDASGDEWATPSRGRKVFTVVALVVGVLIALGGLTTLLGIGPFGYRLLRYGTVKIFVYNGTPHFAEVDVDGTVYDIKPYDGQTLEVVGGALVFDTTLRLVEEDVEKGIPYETDKHEHLERVEALVDGSNWLYHVALPESTCLAITDMSAYYNQTAGGKPKLLEAVFKDNRLRPLDVDDVIYPRGFLPDKAEPPVIWLGVVACVLLEEPALALIELQIEAEEARSLLERRRKERAMQRQAQ